MSETIGTALCLGLGALEAAVCFMIIISAQAITGDARWSGSKVERWSMVRRVSYWGAAIALAMKAVYRFDHVYPMDASEALPQAYLIIFIAFYPIMRAMRVISQDHILSHGNGVSGMLSDVTRGGADQ